MNPTSFSIASSPSQSHAIRLVCAAKKAGLCLLLASLTSGCWAETIKAPATAFHKLQSVLVVALEAPPLEIYPDPIEDRIPAYRHYRNMAMPVSLDTGLYQNSAGVVISGMVSPADTDYGSPAKASQSAWSPSLAIAQLAQQKLAADGIASALNPGYMPLALTITERNAGLQHWHQAIRNWYAQQQTAVDYGRSGQFDAILEVGVGGYRIFEAQTSLQVLLKLIDPASDRVIARGRADTFEVDASALHSLDTDSQAFKNRIAALGERLLSRALADIGWHSKETLAAVTQ